jgi:tetratricopeptide (TPR) repeat protein
MLVGRESHLVVLDDALARARAAVASVVVLHGEAGSGKSALLGHVAESASDVLLLKASGHAAESELPYAGLHQLLGPIASAIDALPEPQRLALRHALILESGPPGDQMATATAVLQLIARQAEARTVLVIADDFQWLDPSTRQVLVFVARRIDADAVAMLLAQRGPLAEELAGIGRPLPVGPMPAHEARTLLRREYPDVSSMVADKVVERAAGLPLDLLEIPAELSIAQREAREPLPSKFPIGEFLERLYQVRLERLDDEARIALLIASFEDLTSRDLTTALAHAGVTTAALAAAERDQLIRIVDGRCVFVHPTVRGAVQNTATALEVERAHEALAACFAHDVARYALYVQGCPSVPDDDVARALEVAAARAEDQGGFAEAATAWEAASLRASGDESRREQRAHAIRCFLRAGAGRQALPLLTVVIDAAPNELERAHWVSTRVVTTMWVEGAPPPDTDELIEFGRKLLAGDADHVRQGVDLLMALASCQFTWGAFGAGKAIVDIVRAAVPFAELPIGHQLTCENLDVMVGAPGAGSFLRTDWIDGILPEHMADPSVPVGFSGVALGWLDDLEAYERVVKRCREMAATQPGLVTTQLAIGSMTVIAMERAGQWDRALLEYANAERFAIDGDFAAPYPYIALRRAYLLATQGKAEACEELRRHAVEGMRRRSPAIDHLDHCVRGMLALALGDYAGAAEALEAAGAIERRMGTLMSGLTSRFVDQFEAYWHLGRSDELAEQLAEFAELGEAVRHPTMVATAARCRALVADTRTSMPASMRRRACRRNRSTSSRAHGCS